MGIMLLLLFSSVRKGMLAAEKKQEDFFPYEKLPNSTIQTVAIDVTVKLFMAE